MRPRSPAPPSRRCALEEAKRRVLADELAREAQAHAEESHRAAVAAEARARAERQARRLTGRWRLRCWGYSSWLVAGTPGSWLSAPKATGALDLALREAEVLRDQAAQAGDDLSRWNLARGLARRRAAFGRCA